VHGVKSLDPFEETSSRAPKGAAVSDDIDVAPSLSRQRAAQDPIAGQSWSALEAAGLLPKRPSDPVIEESVVTDDGWSSDDLMPSGSVEVVPRPIPPPPPSMPKPSSLAAATAAIVLNPATPPPWPVSPDAAASSQTVVSLPTELVPAHVEPAESEPSETETEPDQTEIEPEAETRAVPAIIARSVPVTAAP
jgi:hypothetical protein